MLKTDLNKEIDDLFKITTKIFNLIKLQDWTSLLKLIKSNNIDYNIRDNSNIWLLEYIIMFNQIDIMTELLKKNIRIDIYDEQNRSILYNVIKFSYFEILELLLSKDKEIIGRSILEIKDSDENIPLFYAIKFFNIKSIEIILKYQLNYHIKNKDGENALHISIKTLDINIFKIINTKIKDINIKTNNGESCIHLAIKYKCYDIIEYILNNYASSTTNNQINLNVIETKYNFTPLHYISLTLDYKLISLFEPYVKLIDANIQDKNGNIFYHYFINNIINFFSTNNNDLNQILIIYDIFKKFNFNHNLYNIDGNTPCHILLLNLDLFKKNFDIIITELLTNTDLNIQNKQGESPLFLLVKQNYWKDVINILTNKKLDIFIIDFDKKTIFDYLDKVDKEEFINLITNSYLHIIMNNDYNIKWLDYWDNRCKKNISLEELNETEVELIKNLNYDKNINKDVCYQIIYNKIKNFVNEFLKNKKIHNLNSHPITYKYPILIDKYTDVLVPTFAGLSIDIISGLIYLNEKQINTIISSLKLIDLTKPIVVCNLTTGICEISGFEILWKNYQLFIPTNKNTDLMRELTWIKINKNVRFFCIPIGIEININNDILAHANYMIFDFVTMEVERFEPHGFDAPNGLDYNVNLLDNVLENKINSFKLGFVYISPKKYLPKIGFQIKEIYELKNDYIGDPNGFCAVWCIWWADIRISNPDIPRKKLADMLNKEIINNDYSYKKIIRDYSNYITVLRDKMLTKSNININDWINDNISPQNEKLLNETIKNEIINIIK